MDNVEQRVGRLEVRIDEVVIPKLNKLVDFVDENKSGIVTASALNNKIVTLVLGAMVMAGVYIAAKGGL